ncbi:MAG: InlB B-repeat-containing protein [Lachnospiraceae bacterium]
MIRKRKIFPGLCMFLFMFFAVLSVNALATGTDSAESQTVRYKLTYYLDGGTNNKANPETYTVDDEFTLKSPKKTGYTFDGWYSDSKYTKKVTGIKKGSTGDRKFYAKWTANTYNIKFNGNGAAGGKMSTLNSRKYGKTYTLPANAYKAKTGYYFAGWNTRADGKGTAYADKAKVKNLSSVNKKTVTLYAQWKKILAPKAASSKNVYVDRTVTLSVSNLIPGDKVTFKSSNTKIASVGSSSGKITGKKNGSCTVTAKVKRGSKTYTLKTKVTVKTAKTGNTAGNVLMGGYFAATDGSYTYIAENHASDNYGRIYRVKADDGSGKKQLYKAKSSSVQDISIYGDYIYFLKNKSDLYRMKKDGTGVKKICKAYSYCITEGYIYYIPENGSSFQVYRRKTDSSTATRLKTFDNTVYYYNDGIYCDGEYIYVNAESYPNPYGFPAGRVYRMSLTGKGCKEILSGTLFGVKGKYLYYATEPQDVSGTMSLENRLLSKAALDGTGSKKLAEVPIGGSGTDENPAMVNMDNTYIYYEEPVNTDYKFKIRRMKLDGSEKKSIYSSKGELCGALNTAGSRLLLYDRGFDIDGNSFTIMKMVKKTGTVVRTLFNYTETH